MKKLLLTLLLILAGCAPTREYVSLPAFPEMRTDYRYFIRVPPYTHSAAIFWYYGQERAQNLVYASGVVPIKTQTIETDMHFAYPGRYILVYYYESPYGSKKERKVFNVRLKYSE
jgi:hypothetical protein